MSRVIKFRAIIPQRNATIIFTLQDLIEWKFSNREVLWPWIAAGNTPDQFTGITDRNGVEIYEGDILESEHPVMPYPNKPKLLVEWMNDKNNWNGWNFIPSVIDDFGMTVIGNIYENSELLEAKP